MIRFPALLCFSFLLYQQNGYCQTHSTPVIIKHLLSQKKEIPLITGSFVTGELFRILPQNEMPRQLWQENQYLIYTPGNLYLGINGTGRLYKMSDQDNTLHFIREDSTFYLGNNFCAANFSIGDTMYSYGGYGFWKNNGLLRHYNQFTHEWEVIKTNHEIISNSCIGSEASYFWIDAHNNRFYLAGQKIINDGLKPDSNSTPKRNSKLFVLDIAKGEWTESGVIKDYPETGLVNSPWGPLFFMTFNSHINDFGRNRRLSAKKPTLEKIKKVFSGYAPDIAYFVDSTLYFGNVILNSFDSVQLSINDFEYRGEEVYTPLAAQTAISRNKYSKLIWLAIISFAFAIVFILYKKYKKTNRMINSGEIPHHENAEAATGSELHTQQKFNGRNDHNREAHAFNGIEKELISFIFEKTKQEYTVSVEEINKVLGLSGKNESVQKKNRSETINDINQKWNTLHENNQPLICKQRSEFDKRSFEYFIQTLWLDEVAELSTSFKTKN